MLPSLPGVVLVRSADRLVTKVPGILSRHCFSFGEHYDARNLGFGPLLAVNDETLSVGAGFSAHPHAGVDIVTWVAQGRLEHADSDGRSGITWPGVVQILRAGGGISHSERNGGEDVCRFVQSWVRSDAERSGRSAYEQLDVSSALNQGGFVPLVELAGGAALHAGVLAESEAADLPTAPLLHVFVVRGTLDVDGIGELAQGDSARITGQAELPGLSGSCVAGPTGAEVLCWAMDG